MIAVSYTNFRYNMKSCFDKVAEDKETLIVTRKEENMVVMSQSMYDSIMETLYLKNDINNYGHLLNSIEQYKSKKQKFMTS